MFKKNLQKNKGFTLVETLVAISILSMSILGTFTAVQSSLSKSSYAKDQVTAYYLIQESMEYIRNMRDENQLKFISGGSNKWMTGISDAPGDPCWASSNYCYIDSPAKKVYTCSSDFNSCPFLKQDSATGLYGYTVGWTDTRFKRAIQIQNIDPLNEVIVKVRIDWTSENFPRSLQVQEWFYNIR